jgi:exopolyphosphatase/guanosine-5'-triphosphate,3'-diphosphate pyrophosphatase
MTSRPLAAIDIGTNSVHLAVARPVEGGSPEILAREKAPVRLGAGGAAVSSGDDIKRLDPEAVGRAVAALKRFRRIAEAHDAEVVAVATSAVREAKDRDTFIRRAREEAGVEVEVISGVEEARLIHLGALGAVPIADRRNLVIDIGGGSTELVVADGTEPLLTRSLKLGHIRLTDHFFPGGVITEGSVKACRRHVRAFLAPVAREILELEVDVVVGCSGTIENLARIADASRHGEPGPVDNLVLLRGALDDVATDLVSRHEPADRRAIVGLDDHRRDVIVGGALLLRQLFRSLDIDELIVSPDALREGVVLDRIRRRSRDTDALHHLGDIRRSSVLAVARRYEEDLVHAGRSADLALEIFDQTAELHGLDEGDRDLLEAAGVLHNVGRFVAHAAHHKHSYYVVRNSEHLAGFADHEIELIAQVARYHRKSNPKPKHPEFAALDPHDQHRVRVLAGMLRVAIGLDRTYRRAVEHVTVKVGRKRLTVTAVTDVGADVELELFTARERSALLAEALDRTIEFDAREEAR